MGLLKKIQKGRRLAKVYRQNKGLFIAGGVAMTGLVVFIAWPVIEMIAIFVIGNLVMNVIIAALFLGGSIAFLKKKGWI